MVKLGFTGDVAFSGYFNNRWDDERLIDNDIKQFFSDCCNTVINFENPVTSITETEKKVLAHRSDPKCAAYIEKCFNKPVCSLANNHIMDFGEKGFLDTLEVLEAAGITYFGAGRNEAEAAEAVILGDDIKVGIVSFQYKESIACGKDKPGPICESQESLIAAALRKLKDECDYVVAVYHGGNEFLHAPMPFVRKKLMKYISLGADAVVAHHPHVVQGYEELPGNKYIFYSLGNFIFDTDYQRVQEGTDEGITLKLSFDEKGISFDFLTIKIDRKDNLVKASDSPSRYFRNLSELGYFKVWTYESSRKKGINARARRASGYEAISDSDNSETQTSKQKKESRKRKNIMRFGRTYYRLFGKKNKNIWE